jgi:ribosomal-protein-alanine N-acetyltransferase
MMMESFPILETERLILREFRDEDAQAVFDIYSRDDVTLYLNSETMQSLEEAREKVANRIDLFRRGRGMRWALVPKDHGDVSVGSCGFYLLNRRWASCETGYELHPHWWRRGIMTEAMTAILNFAYSQRFFFPLNRVQALTYQHSQPSIGLLRKLGFRNEGIRREYAYWKGQFHDLRCFSLLRREWMARRSS